MFFADTNPADLPQPDANGNYPHLNGQTINLIVKVASWSKPGAKVLMAPSPTIMTGENGTFALTLGPDKLTDGGYECDVTYNGDNKFFNNCSSKRAFGDITGIS